MLADDSHGEMIQTLKSRIEKLETFDPQSVLTQVKSNFENMEKVSTQVNQKCDAMLSELSTLNAEYTADSQTLAAHTKRINALQADVKLSTQQKYIHIQPVEYNVWQIDHKLNTYDIVVSVQSDNKIISPQSIVMTSDDHITIYFDQPILGRAIICA